MYYPFAYISTYVMYIYRFPKTTSIAAYASTLRPGNALDQWRAPVVRSIGVIFVEVYHQNPRDWHDGRVYWNAHIYLYYVYYVYYEYIYIYVYIYICGTRSTCVELNAFRDWFYDEMMPFEKGSKGERDKQITQHDGQSSNQSSNIVSKTLPVSIHCLCCSEM